ncbi:class I SAM-dependent methyltransferase [Spirosoma utsteinense]|uniref:SAM-dependent methyltransferase n=1 Tax=Spirosoma utsteinense TaxID=2585773 RepID=A0ABR6W8F5_9BACT|nr:class I SAM-dependent methyltransferase [Spirosoma utsteinense]MBC3783910.1 SAM-dependent methyltransferase [Spirosoma utsteinense]MBC3792544.1 SAM-dependent methyltransferase [Spirosoma utsteinense]
MENHTLVEQLYDQTYFDYQREMGKFGGWANASIFASYIKPTDKLIDFGCGGGYLLQQLTCAEKIGIEINEQARQIATENGISTVHFISDVADGWADVIISCHALEHTSRPLDEITFLKEKLKPGGLIVFVAPSEGVYNAFDPQNPDHHLYTWSPMCLGNLFQQAGFSVLESKAIIHLWPPHYRLIAKMGRAVFDICCRIYGFLKSPKLSQSRVVARKV